MAISCLSARWTTTAFWETVAAFCVTPAVFGKTAATTSPPSVGDGDRVIRGDPLYAVAGPPSPAQSAAAGPPLPSRGSDAAP